MKEDNKTQIPVYYKPFFEQVINQRGKISTVKYEKQIEVKKQIIKKYDPDLFGTIKKKSSFQVRAGIDYENISVVKESHESGQRERKGLPENMEKIDVGIYHHKYSDQWYIGCAPIKNEHSLHITEFYHNDELISLDDIAVDDKTWKEILYAKDIKSQSSEWMQLRVQNIKDFTLSSK